MVLIILGLVDWFEGRILNIMCKFFDVELFYMFLLILLGSLFINILNLYKRLFNNIKKKLWFKK